MTDAPPPDSSPDPSPEPGPKRYSLGFLTDQWQWEADIDAATLALAKIAAREALVRVVREETPQLACVTVFEDGVKIGVWDWVEQQAYWTLL